MTKILDLLAGNRVFSIEQTADRRTIKFWEECDNHFDLVVNKAQLGQLIQELQEIHQNME